ncbi:MAG: hypothetical protein ACQER9_04410, partial [Nanobdellota archaeon]
MTSKFLKKAQTATEYLIILAVVIVIALIVVGILGGIPSIGGGANENRIKTYLTTMPVGITNFVVTPAKTTLLFRNNQPNTIRIDEISIDEKVCRSDDLTNPSSKKWTLSVGE